MSTAKRPNVREIALRTGYSKSLVAMALRDDRRVAEKTRLSIRKIAEEMGYQSNPVVAHLMAQLRISRYPSFQSNLALINCSREQDIYRWHTFRDFREGARVHASKLGYRIDDFWLHEAGMHPKRMAQIFRARQIPGIIFVAALDAAVIHEVYEPLWMNYPCVAIGIVKTDPQIASACCDHFQTCKEAVLNVLRLGYQKPALAIDGSLDQLIDRRFSGGYLAAVESLPKRVPVQFCDLHTGGPGFKAWYKKYKPDCIITLHHEVRDWLEEEGKRIPEDVSLAHLDWHTGEGDWAGMVQNNLEAGASAVDLVVHRLHANEIGASPVPKLTMVESRWRDGSTVRDLTARRRKTSP
jgi:LacI family transcriptional regulator